MPTQPSLVRLNTLKGQIEAKIAFHQEIVTKAQERVAAHVEDLNDVLAQIADEETP